MIGNTIIYETITFNYNKVMCIIPESYRVAIIVKHQKSILYNHDVMLVHC